MAKVWYDLYVNMYVYASMYLLSIESVIRSTKFINEAVTKNSVKPTYTIYHLHGIPLYISWWQKKYYDWF